jgi:hypothetical protein
MNFPSFWRCGHEETGVMNGWVKVRGEDGPGRGSWKDSLLAFIKRREMTVVAYLFQVWDFIKRRQHNMFWVVHWQSRLVQHDVEYRQQEDGTCNDRGYESFDW